MESWNAQPATLGAEDALDCMIPTIIREIRMLCSCSFNQLLHFVQRNIVAGVIATALKF